MASTLFHRKSAIWFHLGAILTVTAWGISFISTKILQSPGNDLTPVEVYLFRFTLAYLVVILLCHDRLWANTFVDEILLATCGLCAGSIYFIAENTAIEYTLVANVALITTTAPLLTAMLVGLVYKNERPKRGVIIGSLVAFVGVGFVIFNSSTGDIEINPLGDLLALAAAFGWAIYSIILRRLNALYSALFISRKTFFYGLVTALPFLALDPSEFHPEVLLKPEVWGNILFLGVFASMISYNIWAQAVKRLGPVKASNYLYISPIVTLVASQLFLGEDITAVGVIGCVLILGGVWLGDYLSRVKRRRQTTRVLHLFGYRILIIISKKNK